MKHILLSLLLVPTLALAGEADVACTLERSKAEVAASVLGAPAAYGTIGQDPVSTTKIIIVGVSQSLSGHVQAGKIREAAEARCDALRASLALDSYARWAESSVQHSATVAELKVLEDAISMARANVDVLEPQLRAETVTISQMNDARGVVLQLEARHADLLRLISSAIVAPPPTSSLQQMIQVAQEADARAAELDAEAQAAAGWDVAAQVGVRQEFGGGGQSAFGTVTFKYSFGAQAASRAARDVGAQTKELAAISEAGYAQTVARQAKELQALVSIERTASDATLRELSQLRLIRLSVAGVNTALGQNTARALDVQIKALEAEQMGSLNRLVGYKALLQKF